LEFEGDEENDAVRTGIQGDNGDSAGLRWTEASAAERQKT